MKKAGLTRNFLWVLVLALLLLTGCGNQLKDAEQTERNKTERNQAEAEDSAAKNKDTEESGTEESDTQKSDTKKEGTEKTGDGTVTKDISDKNNAFKLFMTSPGYYVGDIMPMTDEKGIQLYYLFDTDNNGEGYHPIHKFSTTNLYEYSDDGLAIPFATSKEEPDLAIGTGSFLKAEGVYHAFYTGHNDTFPKKGKDKERIMHAISYDNVTWTKIPEDTFTAPEGYSKDDFRDPFVFWNEEEGCYWMLVSARNDKENGFIARYSSKDLSRWELMEPLYAPHKYYMMECPDLFQMGDYYYLFYSWNNVTYYAMAESINGPFTEPEDNVLDGRAFYAAKTAEYQGKRYLFGFIDRKKDEKDTNDYSWAGNLCAYELVQKEDNTLGITMPEQFTSYFKNQVALPEATVQGNALLEGDKAVLESTGEEIAGINFGTLPSSMLLTLKVTVEKAGTGSGFAFGIQDKLDTAFGIQFDANKNLLRYDNCILTRMKYADPRVFTSFVFEPGRTYDMKVVAENEIIVVYMDGRKVLSNRIYKARQNGWGLFEIGGKTVFSDIRMYLPGTDK